MSRIVRCKRCVWYIPIEKKLYGWCKRQTFHPSRPLYKSPVGYCDKGESKMSKAKELFISLGQRGGGKAHAAAVQDVYNERAIQPSATKGEALAFLRVHAKRCRINLANAKDRNDTRAQAHLERKLAVYEYLERVVNSQVNVPKEATRECPECLTHSVDIFGHCACCGKDW